MVREHAEGFDLKAHYKRVKEQEAKYNFQRDTVEDFVQSEWEKPDKGLA